jgi:hypothetical protein
MSPVGGFSVVNLLENQYLHTTIFQRSITTPANFLEGDDFGVRSGVIILNF